MLVPTIGTVIMLRFAMSTPLRIASGTSRALPSPAPTRPFWSPTTISAENEKRRPPFMTLATRFRLTRRSATSDRSYDGLRTAIDAPFWLLKLQAALAGRVCQGLYPSVVEEPTTVEDHLVDSGRARPLGDRAADRGRGPGVLRLQLELHRGRRGHGPAGVVVDQLRVEVVQAAVDGQPRPRRG